MPTYPPGFDRDRAIELGKLIDAAYSQFEHHSNPQFDWNPPGYVIVTTLLAHENGRQLPFGFVATKGSDAYVVIRGTQQPLEWLDDATIPQISFRAGWGRTTLGFNNIYKQLSAGILATMGSLQSRGFTEIYVTGHSLGAALAHLAAADIFIGLGIKPVSYTFSGPRTGDCAFANACDSHLQTWRIFNTEDIVPTLPLPTPDLKAAATGLNDSIIELSVKLLIKSGALGEFQHLQTPIAVTFHKDTIADNHNLTNLYSSL